MHKLFYFSLLGFFLYSCKGEKLPYLGPTTLSADNVELKHQIAPFSFTNQEEEIVTEEYLKNKITIVDFFFSTCPTICPEMTKNMVAIQKKWQGNKDVQFLSHTVDPKTDTPQKLKRYATYFNLNTENWHLVTGDKQELYNQGFHSYMVTTDEDDIAPGGFIHSSLFILVDKNLHIRGIYDGLQEKELKQLNIDIKLLTYE
ncbi:MAG: SCO family protein [Flavobacteriales bacterium]